MPRSLTLAIAALGIGVSLAVVPGLFTVDESNHLAQVAALHQGRLSLAGYAGVEPSPELYFFDPGTPSPLRSPPENRLPPLYGLLAYPFALAGVRGLFLLNALGFVACMLGVGTPLGARCRHPVTPWLGVGLFAFGSFSLEYALGLWPHMLSAALVTWGVLMHERAREAGAVRAALLSGLCVGVAAGVRYQNALIVATLGLALALWGVARRRSVPAFALGAALPLSLSAVLNLVRLGSAHPFSKGPGYLQPVHANDAGAWFADVARSFAFRVWDFRLKPPAIYAQFSELPNPESGAYLWFGVAKKALVQASPWAALALGLLLLALLRPAPTAGGRQRRVLGLVVWAVLGAFACAGSNRSSGLCFNQRYFCDLMPLCALALAGWLDERGPRPGGLGAGSLLGVGLGAWVAFGLEHPMRTDLLLQVPLGLACLLLLCAVALPRGSALPLSLLLGACLGWAALVHLVEDVAASRARRTDVHRASLGLQGRVPDDAALFVWTSYRNAASPLLLEQRITLVEASHDDGVDASKLVGQFLALGRRVLVLGTNYPRAKLHALLVDHGIRTRVHGDPELIELGAHPP